MKAERVYLLGTVGVVLLLGGFFSLFEFTRDGTANELLSEERVIVKALREQGVEILNPTQKKPITFGSSTSPQYVRMPRSFRDGQFHITSLLLSGRTEGPFSHPFWIEIKKLPRLRTIEAEGISEADAKSLESAFPGCRVIRLQPGSLGL